MSDTSSINVTPLARGALSEQIVEQISGWILTGKVRPNETLPPERELAIRFGVSKAAIREAGKVLAAKGLLTIRQGGGTSVNPPVRWNVLDPHILMHSRPRATFQDLLVVRRILEPEIAAIAAQDRDPESLDTMNEAVTLGMQVTSSQEHVRWDMEFHELLAAATGNPIMVILVKSIGQLLRTSRQTLFDVPGSVERSVHHHRKIYDAVAAGDSELARTEMLTHLQQVADDVERWEGTTGDLDHDA